MPGVGKDKDTNFGLCQVDPEQIKEARLSGIVALSEGTRAMGQSLGSQQVTISQKKRKKKKEDTLKSIDLLEY